MVSRRAALAAVPVVLVNVVAFCGQLSYWDAALATILAVVVAATLESIAVYVAYHAHLAQLANDSALRLRLAAYSIAVVIGALNYSHWCAPHWRPTPAAVAFALCSVLSPWLWNIHTRRESRDDLMKLGLLEPHAVRLGGTRWAWHPYRSVRVMRHATWHGETDPAAAIGAVYAEPEAPAAASAAAQVPAHIPKENVLMREFGVMRPTAKKMRAAIRKYSLQPFPLPDSPAGAHDDTAAPAGVIPSPNGHRA